MERWRVLRPQIDFDLEGQLQQFLRALVVAGSVSGVHDIADGGIAVALAELAVASGFGARVSLQTDDRRNDVRWFGECASRALVAVSPSQRSSIENVAAAAGVSVIRIGTVEGDSLTLGRSTPVSVQQLRAASSTAFDIAPAPAEHA